MAVKQTTIDLHNKIKEEFFKMSNIKELGVVKFSTQYILNTIAKKYYKSPKTIENIVFERTALAKK